MLCVVTTGSGKTGAPLLGVNRQRAPFYLPHLQRPADTNADKIYLHIYAVLCDFLSGLQHFKTLLL